MKKLRNKLRKMKITMMLATVITMFMSLKTYATTIGTQEVEIATQNVKDAVIKLAMPVRLCFNVC